MKGATIFLRRASAILISLSLLTDPIVNGSAALAQVAPPSAGQTRDIRDCLRKQDPNACERAYATLTYYKTATRGVIRTYGDNPAAMREIEAEIGDEFADYGEDRLKPHDLVFLYTSLQMQAAIVISDDAILTGNDLPRGRKFAALAVAMGEQAVSLPVSSAMLAAQKALIRSHLGEMRSSRDALERQRG